MKEQTLSPIAVTVFVTDPSGKPLPEARIALAPASEQRKVIELRPDGNGTFRGSAAPGAYVVRAEAGGMAADQREIDLVSNAVEERFVLGKDGLPAYYLGKVRVPFEPTGLVAASLKGKLSESQKKEIDERARGMNLARVAFASDTEDIYRLYSVSDQGRREAVRRLKSDPGVRFAGPVVHHSEAATSFLTDELAVRFKSHVTQDDVARIARELQLKLVRTIPYAGNSYLFQASDNDFDVLAKCEALVRSGNVEYAEPSLVTTPVLDFTPDDSLFAQQEHHPIIDTEAAWDITLGDHNLILAVVDDGCDETHPDFQVPAGEGWTKVVNPFDFFDMDANPTIGGSSHGTKSCGIAAATADNALGVAGVAPGCRLMPLRWPSGQPDIDYADMYVWIAGFNPNSTRPGFPAPLAQGASVISNSFGIYQVAISGVMKDAFDFITTYGRGGKGCVVVFSVGNDDTDFTNKDGLGTGRRWAQYEKTIAVAASRVSPPDAAETKVSTSNFGPGVDLCAPSGGPAGGAEDRPLSTSNVGGGTVASSMGGSLDYDTHGQTSSACPQVSGAAALVLSANPDLTWVEVREILRDTAVKIDFANVDPVGQYTDSNGDGVADYSQWYGFGRLNVAGAVSDADTYAHARDVHVRENLTDDGDVASTGAFWSSPDIWIRQIDPAIEGAAALPAGYLSAPPDEPAKFGQDNWVYVRFRNRGTVDSLNFYIRVYLCHFAGTEFLYPTNFIPTVRPSDPLPVPLVFGTYLIGEAAHGPLAAGDDDIVPVRWPSALVPPETVDVMGSPANWHPCILVEITPQDGPAPTGNHVWDNNNLAQRNISIDYMSEDDTSFASAMVIGNFANRSNLLDLEIDRGKLPQQVKLYIDIVPPKLKDSLRRIVEVSSVEHSDDLAGKLHHLKDKLKSKLSRWTRYRDVRHLKVGKAGGRDAVFVIDEDAQRVRIPLPRRSGELVPLIIGGEVTGAVPKGSYTIAVRQFDQNGRPSGAAAVELRFR